MILDESDLLEDVEKKKASDRAKKELALEGSIMASEGGEPQIPIAERLARVYGSGATFGTYPKIRSFLGLDSEKGNLSDQYEDNLLDEQYRTHLAKKQQPYSGLIEGAGSVISGVAASPFVAPLALGALASAGTFSEMSRPEDTGRDALTGAFVGSIPTLLLGGAGRMLKGKAKPVSDSLGKKIPVKDTIPLFTENPSHANMIKQNSQKIKSILDEGVEAYGKRIGGNIDALKQRAIEEVKDPLDVGWVEGEIDNIYRSFRDDAGFNRVKGTPVERSIERIKQLFKNPSGDKYNLDVTTRKMKMDQALTALKDFEDELYNSSLSNSDRKLILEFLKKSRPVAGKLKDQLRKSTSFADEWAANDKLYNELVEEEAPLLANLYKKDLRVGNRVIKADSRPYTDTSGSPYPSKPGITQQFLPESGYKMVDPRADKIASGTYSPSEMLMDIENNPFISQEQKAIGISRILSAIGGNVENLDRAGASLGYGASSVLSPDFNTGDMNKNQQLEEFYNEKTKPKSKKLTLSPDEFE